MKGLVIALHDVAPSTLPETTRWRSIVAELTDGPVSLLVVPRYGGHDSWRSGRAPTWLRARTGAGDEAVLHGYTHLAPGGREGGELSGRDASSISCLIDDGLDEMHEAGIAIEGFIAPSYVHPASADASCRSAGLRWWATRTSLRWDGEARALPSVGMGASAAARRALSPLGSRLGTAVLATAPAVRLDLHPADLHHRRLERAGVELLERLLRQDRRPLTHALLLAADRGGASAF